MSWLDTIQTGWDSVTESVSEGWDNLIGAEADRVGEKVSGAVEQRRQERTARPVSQNSTSVTPDQYRTTGGGSFDWQKAGVIIGAIGLAFTLSKLAK